MHHPIACPISPRAALLRTIVTIICRHVEGILPAAFLIWAGAPSTSEGRETRYSLGTYLAAYLVTRVRGSAPYLSTACRACVRQYLVNLWKYSPAEIAHQRGLTCTDLVSSLGRRLTYT